MNFKRDKIQKHKKNILVYLLFLRWCSCYCRFWRKFWHGDFYIHKVGDIGDTLGPGLYLIIGVALCLSLLRLRGPSLRQRQGNRQGHSQESSPE